jgi:uncharacterized membrane protein YeiB
MTAIPAPVGPVGLDARALAPDLARGALLLLIAVANAHLFLFGHDVGVRGYPPDTGPVDRVVTLVQVLVVDGRAYPMFGALFGYGLVQLLRRPGVDVGLVRRRGRWLLVFGFAHAALLFSGDIVGAYGLLGLLLGGRIATASPRRLLRTAVPWLLGPALAGAALAGPVWPGQRAWLLSMTVADPLMAVAVRLAEWVAVGLVQAAGVGAAVLVGAWAARRRLLEEPAAHRSTLLYTAALGLPLAVAGAVPLALMVVGVWPDPPLAARFVAGTAHTLSGYGGGFGYAALAGLAAIRFEQKRRGRIGTALAACGQRSLSCYVAQSVVFVAVLAPYGGGLGDRVGVAAAAVIALATWAATVIAADLMGRRGYRGPAETWLRGRTYGRVAH